MRTSKVKSSRPRKRAASSRRGSSLWWVVTIWRRYGSNPLIKMAMAGIVPVVFLIGLWGAGYPQQWGNFILQSTIEATGHMGLRLSEVFVEGRRNAPVKKILAVVNARQGDPLLSYDPYAIKKQLEEISWIRQATVKRQLPGVIFIQLRERQPVALWQHQQKHYLVDDQGVIISGDNLREFETLPVIVGGDAPVHAPHILHLLEKFPDIRKKLTALVRVGGRRWDLHLDKSLQVKLPETKMEDALVRLSLLIQQKKINPLEVAIVDFRVHNQMVVRLSPSAAVRLKGKGKET